MPEDLFVEDEKYEDVFDVDIIDDISKVVLKKYLQFRATKVNCLIVISLISSRP